MLKEIPDISPLVRILFRILLWDKAGKISSGYWNILMMLEDCFDQRDEESEDDSFQLAVDAVQRNISHRNVTVIWKLFYAVSRWQWRSEWEPMEIVLTMSCPDPDQCDEHPDGR